jgi:chemotaxis protein MotA
LGTYAVHGSLAALWVPLEYVAIVGLTVGGFVASNDLKIIKADGRRAAWDLQAGRSSPRALYIDLLAMLFEILAKVRKEGLMSIENDVESPHDSPIFSKYPALGE